jgi:hypothetical protein
MLFNLPVVPPQTLYYVAAIAVVYSLCTGRAGPLIVAAVALSTVALASQSSACGSKHKKARYTPPRYSDEHLVYDTYKYQNARRTKPQMGGEPIGARAQLAAKLHDLGGPYARRVS